MNAIFAGMDSAPVDPEAGAAVDPEAGALLSRLRVIEDQPLDTRAEAFTHLHDQLRQRLEGGDQPA
mgnify:CR=1 FL=1